MRTALPLSTQAQAQAQERSMAVTVDLPNPKEPIHKRVVPLVYAEAIVVSGGRSDTFRATIKLFSARLSPSALMQKS